MHMHITSMNLSLIPSDFHCVGVSGPLLSVWMPWDVIYFLKALINSFQISIVPKCILPRCISCVFLRCVIVLSLFLCTGLTYLLSFVSLFIIITLEFHTSECSTPSVRTSLGRSFFSSALLYTTDMAFEVTIASVAGFRDTPVWKPSFLSRCVQCPKLAIRDLKAKCSWKENVILLSK